MFHSLYEWEARQRQRELQTRLLRRDQTHLAAASKVASRMANAFKRRSKVAGKAPVA